jgi:hypothetical protein
MASIDPLGRGLFSSLSRHFVPAPKGSEFGRFQSVARSGQKCPNSRGTSCRQLPCWPSETKIIPIEAIRIVLSAYGHDSPKSKLLQEDSILLKKARGFQIVSVILSSLAPQSRASTTTRCRRKNERIVWAALSERICLCRMRMTLS